MFPSSRIRVKHGSKREEKMEGGKQGRRQEGKKRVNSFDVSRLAFGVWRLAFDVIRITHGFDTLQPTQPTPRSTYHASRFTSCGKVQQPFLKYGHHLQSSGAWQHSQAVGGFLRPRERIVSLLLPRQAMPQQYPRSLRNSGISR